MFYKVTEFMDDQILMTGFAPGGLSQAPQSFFRTASLSAPLAQEQGIFGIKPEVFLPCIHALHPTKQRGASTDFPFTHHVLPTPLAQVRASLASSLRYWPV